jgi:hypothetical protein
MDLQPPLTRRHPNCPCCQSEIKPIEQIDFKGYRYTLQVPIDHVCTRKQGRILETILTSYQCLAEMDQQYRVIHGIYNIQWRPVLWKYELLVEKARWHGVQFGLYYDIQLRGERIIKDERSQQHYEQEQFWRIVLNFLGTLRMSAAFLSAASWVPIYGDGIDRLKSIHRLRKANFFVDGAVTEVASTWTKKCRRLQRECLTLASFTLGTSNVLK